MSFLVYFSGTLTLAAWAVSASGLSAFGYDGLGLMPWYRVVLAIVCPPLSIVDKGLKAIILTCVLTFLGWVPGVVCALVYASRPADI